LTENAATWLSNDASYLARARHTLIGCVDQPTVKQRTVYLHNDGGAIVAPMKISASAVCQPWTA
jgi:hypothetical protein